MRDSMVESAPERARIFTAVALQNAVLCAECDVVSDSPHDQCLVCGSRSLFNISRMFGGNLAVEILPKFSAPSGKQIKIIDCGPGLTTRCHSRVRQY